MLRCWLSWPPFILNVLTKCVCVSCGFWWQDSEKCALSGAFLVPLLAVYLVEQQLPLYGTSRITEDGTAHRTRTILQIKRYIYIYMYHISGTMQVERCMSVDDTSYYMKPEKNVEQVTQWPINLQRIHCWILTDINFTFCSCV